MAPLPAAQNGFITFGSFNNSCKINPTVIELWAQVLKSVDKSCFLLKFKGGGDKEVKNHYLQQFEQQGIAAERVKIRNVQKDPVEHFRMYGQMDIALDTYPYNGTTTTCEALWMGVPVVSLVGRHHASRVGLSILSRVGLEFFAASTPAEYVAKSTALARKPEALTKIRASMRNRFAAGSLCDARKYAGHVESAYRKMWHKWCQSQSDNVPSEEAAICVE